MEAMQGEILPPLEPAPQRDANGRFAPGHDGGPGRPLGAIGLLSREVRAMITEALKQAGGVDYLVMQAYINPGAFLALVGKTLPMKIEGDPDAVAQIAVTRRIFVEHKALAPDAS